VRRRWLHDVARLALIAQHFKRMFAQEQPPGVRNQPRQRLGICHCQAGMLGGVFFARAQAVCRSGVITIRCAAPAGGDDFGS
jgi:hypothetical protein